MWSKVALAAMVMSGLAGAWHSTERAAQPVQATDSASGRALYQQDCAICHRPDASGSSLGPDLRTVGLASVDFQVSTGRMPRQAIGSNQPAQPRYTSAQIDDLLAYLAPIVRGPAVPQVDPHANVADGGELYQLNCAACHQAAGAGGVLANHIQVPSLTHSSALQVVEAMRTGPGEMPVFTNGFSDEQAAQIAAYVQYLHHPRDVGGYNLGHLGPVPEGLVALVLGLGITVLIARWLGTREPAGRS